MKKETNYFITETKNIKLHMSGMQGISKKIYDAQKELVSHVQNILNTEIQKEFEKKYNLVPGKTRIIDAKGNVCVYSSLSSYSETTEYSLINPNLRVFKIKKDGSLGMLTTLYYWRIE